MAKITRVTKDKAVLFDVNPGEKMPDDTVASQKISDVRFTFTFEIEGESDKKIKSVVSFKKHLASSYKTIGDYQPQATLGVPNTLTNLSMSEFISAFDEYGEYMITKMTGTDTTSLKPDKDIGAFQTSLGLAFTNNNDRFGKYFHCFPTLLNAHARVVDIDGTELSALVNVMRFLDKKGVDTSMTGLGNAAWHKNIITLYKECRSKAWFILLVDALDRGKLDDMLGGANGQLGPTGKGLEARYKEMKAKEGLEKKKTNETLNPKVKIEKLDQPEEDFQGIDSFF